MKTISFKLPHWLTLFLTFSSYFGCAKPSAPPTNADKACSEKPCETESSGAGAHSITLQAPVETLRSVALDLTNRLPYPHEIELVLEEGEIGLRKAVASLMKEDAFADRIVELFGEKLLTDKYLEGTSGIEIHDPNRYDDLLWYQQIEDPAQRNRIEQLINRALARQPLELIRHIIKNNRPFTEILTANYTMVNRYSARSFGLHNEDLSADNLLNEAFYPAQLPEIPHAGILTTTPFLHRFRSGSANRNRHRARLFLEFFLDTNLLDGTPHSFDTAEGSIAPTQSAECATCHDVLDSVAGLFQNWDHLGRLNPPEADWHWDMAPPGLGDTPLPASELPTALQWLGHQTVTDSRFAIGIIRFAFTRLTGVEFAPHELNDPVKSSVAEKIENYLAAEALHFTSANFDIRKSIINIVCSSYYRAQSHSGDASFFGNYLRKARLLTPQELNRKIQVLVGIPWRQQFDSPDNLTSRYKLLYGGIDFDTITQRLHLPNGLMANLSLQMAAQLGCKATAHDFSHEPPQRHLFPYIETTSEPESPEGTPLPRIEQKIRKNLQYLHSRLLGEKLPLDHQEIDHSYALWLETWKKGKMNQGPEETSSTLPQSCQAATDPWTNAPLPNEKRILEDPNFTIRAWAALISYLLSDYKFLHQ